MSSKLMSADEKRNRKNEMTRIRRTNGKNSVVDTSMTESDNVPEPEPELPQAEPEPTAEEIEMKRKEAITEKRRQSLILARSKITPKNQIRKEKDMEIDNAKKEAEEIKTKSTRRK